MLRYCREGELDQVAGLIDRGVDVNSQQVRCIIIILKT